jgi:hypothetical protein
VAEDTALVVGLRPEPAPDTLGLFDHPVEALGAGIADIVGERDQDRWPPGFDGLGEPGSLGQIRVDRCLVEVGQPPSDLGRLPLFEQQPRVQGTASDRLAKLK